MTKSLLDLQADEIVRLTTQNRRMLHYRLVPLIAFSVVGLIMGVVGMVEHTYPRSDAFVPGGLR